MCPKFNLILVSAYVSETTTAMYFVWSLTYLRLTIGIIGSALVIKSVSDLVSDDPADAAVVHVGRPVLAEENTLEGGRSGIR